MELVIFLSTVNGTHIISQSRQRGRNIVLLDLDKHCGLAIYHHGVIYIRCQPPVVGICIGFLYGILMTVGNDVDLICRSIKSQLTHGNIDFFIRLLNPFMLITRNLAKLTQSYFKIVSAILGDNYRRVFNRRTIIQIIIPVFSHLDRCGWKWHRLLCPVVRLRVYMSGRISKRSIQMRIGFQCVRLVLSSWLSNTCRLQCLIIHSDYAVIQIRDSIIRFLTWPYGKLN